MRDGDVPGVREEGVILMARLRCRSLNHRPGTTPAPVVRCCRCRKPFCSVCEGVADLYHPDLCDDCAAWVDDAAVRHRDAGRPRLARAILRRWCCPKARSLPPDVWTPYRRLLILFDLDAHIRGP